jgi:hypothetical protein
MKNIWTLALAILVVVVFGMLIMRSLDRYSPKKVSEKTPTTPITMTVEKKIPQIEDEISRRLREAGLDGGFATVESSLKN